MDLGLSDAEERQVFGWDEEICELCGGFGECADGDCDEFEPDVGANRRSVRNDYIFVHCEDC